jgi:TolB-like protein
MPSLLPGFECDIFISYRHNDNLPDRQSGSEGWVTEFAGNLERELKTTIKETVTLYYDRNPHDGLLETHHVDKSLEGRLRCLVFIPILSQTYCDPKSFAWQHEFCAFNRLSEQDSFGRDVRLGDRNVASRILPVVIHELDRSDVGAIEKELGGTLRGVDFIFKGRGVNRPLRPADDPERNYSRAAYRDQINKLSLAIKELLLALQSYRPGGEARPTPDRPQPGRPQAKCILVLPFTNLSTDPSQEYFSDGLTEELTATLARLKDMRVISRTTSMQYKGSKKDARTISRETGVDYLLEGSVRRHGNNLKITAQLIDAERDIHLWTDAYHGTIDDIFDIQEKVSGRIVEALRIRLSVSERGAFERKTTENPEAYRLYLQGRYFWNRRDSEGLATAAVFFRKAIELDPNFALAWVGLADSYFLSGEHSPAIRRQLLKQQEEAIHKALQLDDTLGEAHISLAIFVMLNRWDWKASGEEFRRGLDLNPNYVTGHHWYSEWLLFVGKTDEAIRQISMAVDLDPASKATIADQAKCYYYAREYDKALDVLQGALTLDPNYPLVHRLLSLVFQAKGQFSKALDENRRWGELTGNHNKMMIFKAHITAASGEKEEAESLVREVAADESRYAHDFRGMALAYTALGNFDLAFDWLGRSIAAHEDSMCTVLVDPKLDPLRSDPRFAEVLRKVGLDMLH